MLGLLLPAACGGSALASPDISWERVDPDPDGPLGPTALIAWRDGYVGVGGGSGWSSPDGRTWTSTAIPGTDRYGVAALEEVDGRLVAVGQVNQVAAAWTSDDGVTWERIPDDPDLHPGSGYTFTELSRIVAGPYGLVAAGTEWGDAGQRPAAWRSDDGVDWERGDPLTGSGTRDIVSTDDGYFLVGADDAGPSEFTRAAFWFSADGLTWNPVPDDGTFGNTEPQAVARDAGGLVATGYRTVGGLLAPATWTSTDGRTWSLGPPTDATAPWPFPGPTPVMEEGALQGGAMWDVAASSPGFTAVGSYWGLDPERPEADGTHAVSFRGAVWQSADGKEWVLLDDGLLRVPAPAADSAMQYGLTSVAQLGGRTVVVGTAPDTGVTLWLGSPPD